MRWEKENKEGGKGREEGRNVERERRVGSQGGRREEGKKREKQMVEE